MYYKKLDQLGCLGKNSFISSSFFISGCFSDDDDNGYGNNGNYVLDQIAGTWVFEKSVAKEIKTNDSKADEAIKADIEAVNNDSNKEKITFYIDGTVNVQFEWNL